MTKSMVGNEQARLWYLSEMERRRGASLIYDPDLGGWVADGRRLMKSDALERADLLAESSVCASCRKPFTASRNDAKYCSATCRQQGRRRRNVTDNRAA
jgi:hypothetical protein